MAIKFSSSSRALERILIYGMFSVGKTKAIMDLATYCAGDIWIIETDTTYDEMLEARPNLGVVEEYAGRESREDFTTPNGTIHLYRPRNWTELIWSLDQVWQRAKRGDWIALDNATRPWEWVQEWYVSSTYGISMDEHMLALREKQVAQGKAGHQVSEGLISDWSAVNTQYNPQFRSRILNPPTHLILTANQKKLSSQQTDKEVVSTYSGVGFMPDGQKNLGHDPRTILWLTRDDRFGNETYKMTTVKDRERGKLDGVEWENFVTTYLKANGWKAGKV